MRNKLTVYFLVIIAASSGLLYVILNAYVLSEFERFEEDAVRANLNYAVGALRNENASLTAWARDYAPWDDTFEFVSSGDLRYITTNFAADTIENLDFDLILFIDDSKSVVWSYVAGPAAANDLNLEHLPFLQLESLEWDSSTGVSGFHPFTENTVYQFAAHPILTTEARGPNRGSLIFGRKLDNQRFEKIVAASVADFDLQSFGSDQAWTERAAQIESAFGGVEFLRRDGRLSATTVLRDFNDTPVLILRVGTHRDTVLAGSAAVKHVMTVYVIVAAAAFLIWWLLVVQITKAYGRAQD